jgi:hypothetical protein
LLRVSAQDAQADRKLQGLDQDFENIKDMYFFGDPAGEGEASSNGGNIDLQDHYDAFPSREVS